MVLNTLVLFEDSPNVLFLKGFFIRRFLKSVQILLLTIVESYNCTFSFNSLNMIKKKILFPCSNARYVPVKFYITYIIISIVLKPIRIFAVDITCYLDLISANYMN